MRFQRLFEPAQIGTLHLRNRLVLPAIFDGLGSEIGSVTQRQIDYYAERAKGGTGLVMVAYVCIDYPEGGVGPTQLRLDDDSRISGHNALVEAVQDFGARVGIQLVHPGREKPPDPKGVLPTAVAPSAIPSDLFPMITPRELVTEEVEAIVGKFAAAAKRAKDAGYDLVEIHGAHGYLVAEFMSARANNRTDKYGGDTKGRMTFPLEVIGGVRAAVGSDYPLVFRMCADEFVDGGLNLEETKVMAKMLEEAGIDALDVSGGCYASIDVVFDTMEKEEGWRSYLAGEIKKVVNIPVFTVGAIRSPEVAERILERGDADFVGLGRTLIADPHWVNKVKAGQLDDVVKCVSCNIGCLGRMFRGLPISCSLNPVTSREGRWARLEPAAKSKKVIVVGGGPAGMETARIATLRGHQVTLYEKGKKLGGQLTMASVPPGKEKYNWYTDYLAAQMKKLKIRVELEQEATVNSIQREKPDVVVVATGAEPIILDIPGVANAKVVTAWDVLSKKVTMSGEQAVVVGGGTVGCETAEFLLASDNRVTIVEMLDAIANDMEMVHMIRFFKRLPALNIQVRTGCTLNEVIDKGVVVTNKEGKQETVEADRVVLALGAKPIRYLADALEGKVPELYVIGDSTRPAKVIEAVYDGSRIARFI